MEAVKPWHAAASIPAGARLLCLAFCSGYMSQFVRLLLECNLNLLLPDLLAYLGPAGAVTVVHQSSGVRGSTCNLFAVLVCNWSTFPSSILQLTQVMCVCVLATINLDKQATAVYVWVCVLLQLRMAASKLTSKVCCIRPQCYHWRAQHWWPT